MRQTLTNVFCGLHKNISCAFPLTNAFVQIKHLWQMRIFTAFTAYFVISSPSCYSWVIKWNEPPVTLIGENNKARILNTRFKIKLLALVEQLVTLLKRNFPTHFFRGEFPDNFSSKFLLVAGSEKLYSKSFLLNTMLISNAMEISREKFFWFLFV